MSNCKTIAMCNQKGGVGKTTSTVNLGVGLAMQGKRVLLVDADPQGDLTTCLGWKDTDSLPITLLDKMSAVMRNEAYNPFSGILHHDEKVDLIPANLAMSALEMSLVEVKHRETVMKNYRNLQCKYHVLLDNDDAGRRSGQEAEIQGLLNTRNTTYTICNGSPNAEFEDCLEKTAYAEAILSEFGVDLNVVEFRSNKKWSDRVADCFRSQGKQWNDMMEKRVKLCVAESLPADPAVTLNQYKRSSIDALVTALNSLIT